jgi:serine/threonine protein kinase
MILESSMSAATLVGRTIARYRIVERLGAGGMGEVFKAIDNVLHRPVALKILRLDVVHDEVRLRRFVGEAQSASALNHPNIVTIHDVGTSIIDGADGESQTINYIAMELIEGDTLSRRIYGGASLPALLEVMRQVADALAKAHGAGILHRDLKPDNIMVTTDGRAKVVDFGLAKLIQGDIAEHDDTVTVQIDRTREGVVLGTVGYMSPEQIEGGAIDGRSDVFSFGCVLYEAVCRKRPFVGRGTIDTLHMIQRSPHASVSTVDTALPAALERITDRCLAKDPDDRYQSMKEVVVELRLLLQQSQSGTSEPPLTGRIDGVRRRPLRGTWLMAPLVAVASIAGLATGARLTPVPETELSTYRFTPLQTMPEYEGSPVFSPDGRSVAYIADVNGVLQVFIRSLEAMRGVQLTHSVQDCVAPFWLPDGSEIYYISVAGDRDAIWSIGTAGGKARVVLQNVAAAALSPENKMLAFLREQDEPGGSSFRLWLASPPSAPPHAYLTGDFAHRMFESGSLAFSPDGLTLGAWLTVGNMAGMPHEFWLIDTKNLHAKRVLLSLSDVVGSFPFSWMPDSRRILFSGVHGADQANGLHLWIADTVTDRVRALTASSGSEAAPTVSSDGSKIVFAQEDLDTDVVSIPLVAPRLETVLSTARAEHGPVWSPSGTGFAYITNRSGTDEIWFRSNQGDWERPVATNKDFNDHSPTVYLMAPSFSPDGQRIAYLRQGAQTRLWVSPIAGGPAVPLGAEMFSSEEHFGKPTWSPDATSIAFVDHVAGRSRLVKLPLGINARPIPLIDNITQAETHWSPDGQWLTASTTKGFSLVSADGSIQRKISEGKWAVHVWSNDSAAIYGIRVDDDLHLILSRLTIEGTEHVIADLGVSPPTSQPFDGFSLSPDGKTFLTSMLKAKSDLWMLEGFDVVPPWWKRWAPFI